MSDVSHEPERPADAAGNALLMRRATYASVAVALFLIVIKAAAWMLTGSVSLLTTLVDSMVDLATSAINLLAVRHALEPPDDDHRFGHGKAEPLAGLGQAAFVIGTAVFLVVESARRIFDPQQIENESVGVVVMLVSMAATFALVRYQRRVVARTGSLAVGADSLHYAGDFLIHGGVVISLLLYAQFGWTWIDPIFALAVAAYIVYAAKGIATEALNALMDRELPEEDRQRIVAIALAHPEVRNIHDLRTRSAGMRAFIQFHLTLPQDISLMRAHEIADTVELQVREAFPGAGVIVHEDPEGLVENWESKGLRRFETDGKTHTIA